MRLNPEVALPAEVYFFSQGQALAGGLAGPIGAVAAASGGQDEKAEFKRLLAQENFDVGRELLAVFQSKLAAREIQVVETAGHQFTLSIRLMGLGVPNGFYSGLRPMLVVDAVLTDDTGAILFKQAGSVMNLSSRTDRHTMREYRENPTLLTKEYRKAIDAVTDELIETYVD